MLDLWSRLMCPNCHAEGLRLSANRPLCANELPEYGYAVCDTCQRLYPIAAGILDLAVYDTTFALTLAGQSNHFFPTPQLYERIWRTRALTLLTGESFPVAREMQWLDDWTQVRAGEYVIDLGTSTGLYARGLSKHGATLCGVDLAWGMLREAQHAIRREQRAGIVLLRAAAEKLPFRAESMDAVVVGGSLNEMRSIAAALQEALRVVRPGGRMVTMSLGKAYNPRGRWLQKLAGASGIQFPTVSEFNTLAENAGWKIARQELKGIVLFSLLTK
jgi:SAM-dependent methyltransferase/uncharacterized protein YbaR (Trm112 family)